MDGGLTLESILKEVENLREMGCCGEYRSVHSLSAALKLAKVCKFLYDDTLLWRVDSLGFRNIDNRAAAKEAMKFSLDEVIEKILNEVEK